MQWKMMAYTKVLSAPTMSAAFLNEKRQRQIAVMLNTVKPRLDALAK